jgi:hypothetical protein
MTFIEQLQDSIKASVESTGLLLSTLLIMATLYATMILASFPAYSIQLLGNNLLYFPTAMEALTVNLYASSGLLAVILTVLYSITGGVAITNLFQQLKFKGLNLKNAASLSPGIIVSGCAGCGAGVLGLAGLTGALTLLPFKGNLIRLGGIGLLVYFLGKSGDPKKCEVS